VTAPPDSTRPPPAPGDSAAPAATPATATPPTTPPAAPRGAGFTVQFASLLSEEKAREESRGITVEGKSPRVVSSVRGGATIFRVVMGPYPTKAEAERVGRASGHDFWVFEGAP